MIKKKSLLLLSILFIFGCSEGKKSDRVYNPQNTLGLGPAPVVLSTFGGNPAGDLASSGNYVILAKTGISTTGTTSIVGDLGLSPAAETFVTGFSLARHASNQYSTDAVLVTGEIYSANLTAPTPANLTSAISSMETAYVDAAGRTNPDFTELGTGLIGGLDLTPGLYKWSSNVLISTDITITGSATDVWIMQIAGNLNLSNGINITLVGALPENIYWQVAGQVTIGTTADFKGIILGKTAIIMQNGSSLNGRAFAQTAVTLDATTVAQP